uniref:6,7-dimethyl-8-ribityllumazine synthase n=1 Tax=candidate division WOR-3 bacterium TaxID=2052148 RepID=A0A7C4UCG8_UNCW3
MEYQGRLIGKGKKIGIVVSRFNSLVTKHLLDGAIDCLKRHGVEDYDIYWTPGSFEIPIVLKKIVKKYDGLIALSAVIRGDTPHFDFVANEISKGIARISLDSGVPISFGVITADTEEQALTRAGLKHGNKGWDAAMSVIEMINLMEEIK